jgi:mitochondrial inner membrane protease subunit 2
MNHSHSISRALLRNWGKALSVILTVIPPTIAFTDSIATLQIVSGQSMSPVFNPDPSDMLDVVCVRRNVECNIGDVVLLVDPMHSFRMRIIKRISAISPDGSSVYVLGDNSDHSTDSRKFGWVPSSLIEGKVTKVIFPPWRWGASLDHSSVCP